MDQMLSAASMQASSRGRRVYILALFTALYMMMYTNRNILSLLLDSIKHDMKLSDTELALIAGFGFSLFHTLVGFPVARWADRGDRRVIITLSALMWSGMTMVAGVVQSVTQLALARIGVGVGEASTTVLHAVLADETDKNSRPAVISILMMGGPLAALLCYPAIGWLEAHFGWRGAFIGAGIPGLILGAIVWFTFRDTAHDFGTTRAPGALPRAIPPLRETLASLSRQRTFVLTVVGYVISQIGVQGFTVWAPTYLRRMHGLSAESVALYFGVVTGLLGLAGALASAFTLTRSSRYGDKWKLLWPAIATLLIAPFVLLAAWSGSTRATLVAMGFVSFFVAFKFGPVVAVALSVVHPRMRAVASAIQGFTASVIAIGGGPLLVGAISDALRPSMGEGGMRYALTLCAIVAAIGAGLMALGSRSIEADIAAAEAQAHGL
jgi:MFS family permease